MSLLSKEYVFIEVDALQQKNTPNSPPEDLIIEFPPVFNEEELGSKILRNQSINCNSTTRVSSNRRKPPNAFILFRKKYLDALHRRGQRYPMKNVSGWARDAWKSLPKYQKQEYENIATRAASLYHEWASSSPNKKRQNKNTRRNKPNNENNNTGDSSNNNNNNKNKNNLSNNTTTTTTTTTSTTTTITTSSNNNNNITKPTINTDIIPSTTILASPIQKKAALNNNDINVPILSNSDIRTPLSSTNSSAINSPTSPIPSPNNFTFENLNNVYTTPPASSTSYLQSSPLLTDNDFYYQFSDSQRTCLSSSSNGPFDKLTANNEFVSPTMNSPKVEYDAYSKEDDNDNNNSIFDNIDANDNYPDYTASGNGINDPSNQNSYYHWIAQQTE